VLPDRNNHINERGRTQGALIQKLGLLRKQENLIIFDLLKKHCYKVNNNLYKLKYLKFFLSQLYCYPDQQNTIHIRGRE